MKIKLYYNFKKNKISNIKYENFELYINEENKIIFYKLSDKNNLNEKDFIIVEEESLEKIISDIKLHDALIENIFFDTEPENNLNSFTFFKTLKENKVEKIKKLLKDYIKWCFSYFEKPTSLTSLNSGNIDIFFKSWILKKFLEENQKYIEAFLNFYEEIFKINWFNLNNQDLKKLLQKHKNLKEWIDPIKSNFANHLEKKYQDFNRMVKTFEENKLTGCSKNVLQEFKNFMEYDKDDFKEKYTDVFNIMVLKIKLILLSFEEGVTLFYEKNKKNSSKENVKIEKKIAHDFLGIAKKYENYFQDLKINGNISFFYKSLFRVKIYLYLKLMDTLKELLELQTKNNEGELWSKVFKTSQKESAKTKGSAYKNLTKLLSYEDFIRILNYLEENNKINQEDRIKLFRLYSQYNKIDIDEIIFFDSLLSYELNSPFLDFKTRIPNTLETYNFQFYNSKIEKIEYYEMSNTETCIPNSIYVLKKNDAYSSECNAFIGKFLTVVSENKLLFEDVSGKTGIQIIDTEKAYKLLGKIKKIEFDYNTFDDYKFNRIVDNTSLLG